VANRKRRSFACILVSGVSLSRRTGNTERTYSPRRGDLFPPSNVSSYVAITSLCFKVTMSLGFSVGDFIIVFQLASQIRKRFVDAPEQFKAISEELSHLDMKVVDRYTDYSLRQRQKPLECASRCRRRSIPARPHFAAKTKPRRNSSRVLQCS
jgi:hypothetical protein